MIGVAAALVVWRIVVPWDLSEEAAQNPYFYDPAFSSGRGGDDYAPEIALVLVVLTVFAMAVILAGRPDARWFGTAAAATWAVLFAWRAAVSRTSGANMWPVAFVMLVGPAAVIASLFVHATARWRSRRPKDVPRSTD